MPLEITLDRHTDVRVTTPDGKSMRITLLERERDVGSFRATLGFDGRKEDFKISRENHPTGTGGGTRK